MRQGLPNLFGDKGHERMQELQGIAHNPNQDLAGALGGVIPRLQTGLCQFNIPIAELIPDKIIKLLNRDSQFKLFQIFRDLFGDTVKGADNPLVL